MKKLLFAFCFIFSLAAQAQEIKFLCDSVFFKTPQVPKGYYVEAVSAKGLTYNLGDTASLQCYFQFYRRVDGELQFVSGQNDVIPAKVVIPLGVLPSNIANGQTQFYLHKVLFSGDKHEIYRAAFIFGFFQGYFLKPEEQQTDLNALYP